MKQDRYGITVDIICNHPDIKNNTCPTAKGNCAECRYCIAVLSATDYFKLEQNAQKKTCESCSGCKWGKTPNLDVCLYCRRLYKDGYEPEGEVE